MLKPVLLTTAVGTEVRAILDINRWNLVTTGKAGRLREKGEVSAWLTGYTLEYRRHGMGEAGASQLGRRHTPGGTCRNVCEGGGRRLSWSLQ